VGEERGSSGRVWRRNITLFIYRFPLCEIVFSLIAMTALSLVYAFVFHWLSSPHFGHSLFHSFFWEGIDLQKPKFLWILLCQRPFCYSINFRLDVFSLAFSSLLKIFHLKWKCLCFRHFSCIFSSMKAYKQIFYFSPFLTSVPISRPQLFHVIFLYTVVLRLKIIFQINIFPTNSVMQISYLVCDLWFPTAPKAEKERNTEILNLNRETK